jgi:hypothetical protein
MTYRIINSYLIGGLLGLSNTQPHKPGHPPSVPIQTQVPPAVSQSMLLPPLILLFSTLLRILASLKLYNSPNFLRLLEFQSVFREKIWFTLLGISRFWHGKFEHFFIIFYLEFFLFPPLVL